LPAPWKTVSVKARLVPPDGLTGRLSATAVDESYQSIHEVYPAALLKDGTMKLTLYDGHTYILSPLLSGGAQQLCTRHIRFMAKDGLDLGTVATGSDWGDCKNIPSKQTLPSP